MESNASEPTPPRPGALQSMLARLRGMAEAMLPKAQAAGEEAPAWDPAADREAEESAPAAPPEATTAEVPVAAPVAAPAADAVPPAPPAAQRCPHCGAPRDGTQSYCDNCGWIF